MPESWPTPPKGQANLEQAQRIIATCTAVRAVVTVRTYQGVIRTQEQARKVCLADLVTRIQQIGHLDLIKLDTIDSLGISRQSAHAASDDRNRIDLETLEDLRRFGELD